MSEEQSTPLPLTGGAGKVTDLNTGIAIGELKQRVTAVESLRDIVEHLSGGVSDVRATVEALDRDVAKVKSVLDEVRPVQAQHGVTLKKHDLFVEAQAKANTQIAERFVQIHEEMVALKAVADAMAAVPPTVSELNIFIRDIKNKLPESSVLYAWVKEKKDAEDKVIEQNKRMIAQLRVHAVQQTASGQNMQPIFLMFVSLILGTLINRVGNSLPLAWIISGYGVTVGLLFVAAVLYLYRAARTQARLRRLESHVGYVPLSEDDDPSDD